MIFSEVRFWWHVTRRIDGHWNCIAAGHNISLDTMQLYAGLQDEAGQLVEGKHLWVEAHTRGEALSIARRQLRSQALQGDSNASV